MEPEPKNVKKSEELEQEIIDNILFKDQNLAISFQDLISNTLLSKDNCLSQGMTAQDFDLIFSTQEAIDKEILHTLIVCPNKYDPNSKYCQLLKKEDVKFTEEQYDNFNKLIKNDYKSFKIMLTPRIRRNLIFNITTLKYKKMINDKESEDFEMKHDLKGKDILCLVSHKLKIPLKDPKNPHKYGKIIQILEQLQDVKLDEFWNYYGVVYIIFCVQNEEKMKEEYAKFPREMKEVEKSFKNVKIIFFIESQINKEGVEPKLRNMFIYNTYGKNYFFLMNPEYKIYRADNMLFSGDIVEDSIKLKQKEKEDKTKDQEKIKSQRFEAFINIYNFYTELYKCKYALYFSCEFEICLKYDIKKRSFFISYIDFYKIAADLRPKEWEKVQAWTKILKEEDWEDVRKIDITDIHIDFTKNECKICKSIINEKEPMYYCYKCKDKYCSKCVMDNYNKKENEGKKKFIDKKHNLLFFKTRNKENFKNIDQFKLGNDLFTQVTDDKLFENFQRLCYGCKRKFNDSPRYICINCNKGSLVYGRYHDYCYNCIEHMMKGDDEGDKIQQIEERLYGFETRTLLTNNEVYRHNNNEHIYLMVALEVKDKNDF